MLIHLHSQKHVVMSSVKLLLHVSVHLHHPQSVFNFVLAKVTKLLELLKINNSIQVVDRCFITFINVNEVYKLFGGYIYNVDSRMLVYLVCWQDARYTIQDTPMYDCPHCICSHQTTSTFCYPISC